MYSEKKDQDEHEKAVRPHHLCNENCSHYVPINGKNIQVMTPEMYAVALYNQQASESEPATQIQTMSNSVTSTRKCRREPTLEEDPEKKLDLQRAKHLKVISTLKICCILNPSKACRTYKQTENEVSWVEARLPREKAEVNSLMDSGELKGYVFHIPQKPHSVKINNWVSHIFVCIFDISHSKAQVYIAYSCFREAGYKVVFRIWQEFSDSLVNLTPAVLAKNFKEDGFDCIFGGIDLSVWCIGLFMSMRF